MSNEDRERTVKPSHGWSRVESGEVERGHEPYVQLVRIAQTTDTERREVIRPLERLRQTRRTLMFFFVLLSKSVIKVGAPATCQR